MLTLKSRAEDGCAILEVGCQLVLTNLPAQVRRMLILSCLDMVIATALSVEVAMATK